MIPDSRYRGRSWSVEGILETGRLIDRALKELPHGEKSQLWDKLPFSGKTGQRLVKIAKDPRLTNAAFTHLLPPSWYSMYELTKLDDETFEKAIEKKTIKPNMGQHDAAKLSRVLWVPIPEILRRILIERFCTKRKNSEGHGCLTWWQGLQSLMPRRENAMRGILAT